MGDELSIMDSYDFTHDWFSHSIHLFEKYLSEFRGKVVNFLEIGSYEGRSATYFLDNILRYNHLATLTCVDPHLESDVKYRFCKNLSTYISGGQCKYHQMSSLNYFLNFKSVTTNHFDFIYIDGAHDQQNVLQDMVMSFILLKSGGIMAMDDYMWRDSIDNTVGPKEAIDGFLESYKMSIEIHHKGYQVWLRKL